MRGSMNGRGNRMPPIVSTNRNRGVPGSGQQRAKITIKPFAKPPKLPDNYYEETAALVLKGTLQFLEQRNGDNDSSKLGTMTSGTTSTSSYNSSYQFSFQSAYNNTVHLVSHHFGGRLYSDLVQTLQVAAEQVLQPQVDQGVFDFKSGMGLSENFTSGTNTKILHYIVEQYIVFTDYLLLCKHVLTPLDRTWQWHDASQRAIPIATNSPTNSSTTTTTKTTTNTNTSSNNASDQSLGYFPLSEPTLSVSANNTTNPSSGLFPLQNIWQVGLTCFLRRLQELGMDKVLYQQWLNAFLQDWGSNNFSSGMFRTSSSNNESSPLTTTTSRQTLQQVWYIWQDLGLLNQLPIHQDLEQYWSRVSKDWTSHRLADSVTARNANEKIGGINGGNDGEYPASQFILFCYEKHLQCYNYRQWLPIVWLWNILDFHLFQPHMMVPANSPLANTNTTSRGYIGFSTVSTSSSFDTDSAPLLLQDRNLHPILQSAMLQQNRQGVGLSSPSTTIGMKWTTIQILWMLAGRLEGGQKSIATAIQRFARIQGLQCVHTPNINNSGSNLKHPPQSIPATTTKTSVTYTTNVNAVQALLQLQDSMSALIHSLPVTTSMQSGSSGGGIVLLPNSPLPNYSGGSNNIFSTGSNNTIISLKSVWEEVVNVDTQPSIAEQLAKFLDSILKSNKKIDMYQNQYASNNTIGGNVSTQTPTQPSLSATTTATTTTWLQRIVMGLFVPLSSKDVFEAFYKKDLAKRLLWGRVVSMDIEKQVCSLLKSECGAAYTAKMEGMFQDIEWSRESMLMYKESIHYNSTDSMKKLKDGEEALVTGPVKSVEMEVQVLTTGYWPVYPQYPNLQLPTSFQQPQKHFENYYKTKYQGRRMTWQYALGHCTVRAFGFAQPYEFLVSMCQALTLIQFTNNDTVVNVSNRGSGGNSSNGGAGGGWTLPALQRAIGLDDRDEMERILQSLALGKDGTRILRKIDYERVMMNDDSTTTATTTTTKSGSPRQQSATTKQRKGPPPAPATGGRVTSSSSSLSPTTGSNKKGRMNVDDKDIFVVNDTFESPVRRIRINNILMKETKEEHDKTIEGISRDRLYLIDAVLVRIMKARKSIVHQQLIPQVLEQIKVPAVPADVKKRIESLIEREYMERDSKDRNRYNYLA